MSSVNKKIEGLRWVLSPKKSAVSTKNVSFPEEVSDHHKKCDGDSDDETHVLVSHHVDVEHIFDTSQEPFLSDLMNRKAFVQVAPSKQKDSPFVPSEDTTHFQITDNKPRFPFPRSEVRYLSIHQDSEDEAKAYIQYKKVGRKKIFVLQDDCQESFALCMTDGRDLHCKTAYVIYSRRPLEDDDYNLDAVQYEGATFYPWIRVAVKSPQDLPTFQVWNGRDFEDIFCTPEVKLDTDDDTVMTANSSPKRFWQQKAGAAFRIVGPKDEGQVCSSATRN